MSELLTHECPFCDFPSSILHETNAGSLVEQQTHMPIEVFEVASCSLINKPCSIYQNHLALNLKLGEFLQNC